MPNPSKKKKKPSINIVQEFKDIFTKPSAFANADAAKKIVSDRKKRRR